MYVSINRPAADTREIEQYFVSSLIYDSFRRRDYYTPSCSAALCAFLLDSALGAAAFIQINASAYINSASAAREKFSPALARQQQQQLGTRFNICQLSRTHENKRGLRKSSKAPFSLSRAPAPGYVDRRYSLIRTLLFFFCSFSTAMNYICSFFYAPRIFVLCVDFVYKVYKSAGWECWLGLEIVLLGVKSGKNPPLLL